MFVMFCLHSLEAPRQRRMAMPTPRTIENLNAAAASQLRVFANRSAHAVFPAANIKFTNSGGLIAQRGMISVGFQNFKSRGRDSNPGINALQAFPLAAWVPLRGVFGVFHVL